MKTSETNKKKSKHQESVIYEFMQCNCIILYKTAQKFRGQQCKLIRYCISIRGFDCFITLEIGFVSTLTGWVVNPL
jgi:hypothetical protein